MGSGARGASLATAGETNGITPATGAVTDYYHVESGCSLGGITPMSWETMMPSRRLIERTPERPPIRPFELSAADRACIERLVGHTLALVEREFILQTLRDNQGNRTRSARLLAISIRSLRDKIRSYRDQGESVPEPASFPLQYTAGRRTNGFRH